ncbi:MAG: hypothetical protein K2G12_08880, partial [Prevotella sp.]|nr:hypothetical protein [Prevotella sp.]
MRKILLAMTAMLIAVIGHAAPAAGTSEALLMYNSKTATISVNGDPGLQHLTIKNEWGSSADFSWGVWVSIKIEGTGINQTGLTEISKNMTNSDQSSTDCTLDLRESDFTEAVSSIPNKFSKLLLAPGKTMPSIYALETSTKLKYAYSGEKDGDKTIHLYASDQITSVNSISELADIESFGAGWTVYLSGRNEAIETALREKGVTVEYAKEAFNGTLVINGEEDIKELIKSALPEGESLSAIKTLIIKGHTISQTELDYLAAQLADLHTMNLADATMPDDVRLNDNSATAHWITLVLPKGTKIRPNFKKYDKLRYAVGGALEKIWIINRDGAGSLRSSDIASILPDGINTPKDGLRLGVAFVGPTNLDDIRYLVGESNAPLNSARIWHFYNAEGLTEDDFDGLEELTSGTYDNMTSIVLPPGFDIDHILKILHDSYRIGNIYNLSDGDNGRTLTVNVKNTETFDIARFATVDTRIVVLKGGTTVDNNIIDALNSTKRAVCVDLSEMSFTKNSDEILNNVRNGSVMYVKLPSNITFNINHYDGTTFGAIARIKNDENTAVCYQRVPGTLNKMTGYRSPEMLEHEHIRYRGLFDMHDIEHLLANNKNVYCDMSDVSIVKYNNGETAENKIPHEFSAEMITDD